MNFSAPSTCISAHFSSEFIFIKIFHSLGPILPSHSPLIHGSIHALINLYSSMHSPTQSSMYPAITPSTHSNTHLSIYSTMHPFVLPFIHPSMNHSCIYSYICPFGRISFGWKTCWILRKRED